MGQMKCPEKTTTMKRAGSGGGKAMEVNRISINGKTVQLGQPYRAQTSELVGRDREMKKILAAWMGSAGDITLSPLLVGGPGMGKNRLVYECARVCAKELYIFQGHEDVSAEDLICAVRFSDDRERQMDYIMSPIVTAMIRGGICFIDEIAKIRPRALAPLASLLDERRYIDSIILGERIYAHPGFRLVGATNTIDLQQNQLPDFIQSRMRPVITVEFPGRAEIDAIVTSRFHSLNSRSRPLLDKYWNLWAERYGDHPPTPRDSIYIFGYAHKLADFESAGSDRPLVLDGSVKAAPITEAHIARAMEAFFKPTDKRSA